MLHNIYKAVLVSEVIIESIGGLVTTIPVGTLISVDPSYKLGFHALESFELDDDEYTVVQMN